MALHRIQSARCPGKRPRPGRGHLDGATRGGAAVVAFRGHPGNFAGTGLPGPPRPSTNATLRSAGRPESGGSDRGDRDAGMPFARVVLAMIEEPPAPFGNAAARWFYVLLRGLVGRGHRVTAFAACSKPREIEESRALFPGPDYGDLRPLRSRPAAAAPRRSCRTLRRPYSLHVRPPDLPPRSSKRELAREGIRRSSTSSSSGSGWLRPRMARGEAPSSTSPLPGRGSTLADAADRPGRPASDPPPADAGAEARLIRAYPRRSRPSPFPADRGPSPRSTRGPGSRRLVPLGIDASASTPSAPMPPSGRRRSA